VPIKSTRHKIITGDSRAIPCPNESIALVVTSPPYPMIEMWDSFFASRNPRVSRALLDLDGQSAFWLMHDDLDAVWREVARVLRPGGWACINIGDATRKVGDRFALYSNHTVTTNRFISLGFDALPLILWRKQTNAPNKFMGSGMLPAGAYVTLEHEYILIMRKGRRREFTSPEEKRIRQSSAYFWEERNRWFSDIWDFKGARQSLSRPDLRERSAAFPLELPHRLIQMYSIMGDSVLDPFLGTGTTTLAAMASGRDSIGMELDPALSETVMEDCLTAADSLNQLTSNRAKDHLEFVERYRRERGEPKHRNTPHGFPVVTSQEVNLELNYIDEVKRTARNECAVSYRPASPRSIPMADGPARQRD
jgi:DNA modification methylase